MTIKTNVQLPRSSKRGVKPKAEELHYGNLAVNFAAGDEFLSTKNSSNEVVVFPSKNYFENHPFSSFTSDKLAVNSGASISGDTIIHGNLKVSGDTYVKSGNTLVKIENFISATAKADGNNYVTGGSAANNTITLKRKDLADTTITGVVTTDNVDERVKSASNGTFVHTSGDTMSGHLKVTATTTNGMATKTAEYGDSSITYQSKEIKYPINKEGTFAVLEQNSNGKTYLDLGAPITCVDKNVIEIPSLKTSQINIGNKTIKGIGNGLAINENGIISANDTKVSGISIADGNNAGKAFILTNSDGTTVSADTTIWESLWESTGTAVKLKTKNNVLIENDKETVHKIVFGDKDNTQVPEADISYDGGYFHFGDRNIHENSNELTIDLEDSNGVNYVTKLGNNFNLKPDGLIFTNSTEKQTKIQNLVDDTSKQTKINIVAESDHLYYNNKPIANLADIGNSLWEAGTGEGAALLKGSNGKAAGKYSVSEGYGSSAYGDYSHAEGSGTSATSYSHSEGSGTSANGFSSHVEGQGSLAQGFCSHAEGNGTNASGSSSHAEGIQTKAVGQNAHAEGNGTSASTNSHSEGVSTYADGISHAEGQSSSATSWSHSEGYKAKANQYSHAEGYVTTATSYSHAEGSSTNATNYSHAEGNGTNASGNFSHAEGNQTKAVGESSHAEGASSEALGINSHAEGGSSIADGYAGHVEGLHNHALNVVKDVTKGDKSITVYFTLEQFNFNLDYYKNCYICSSNQWKTKITGASYDNTTTISGGKVIKLDVEDGLLKDSKRTSVTIDNQHDGYFYTWDYTITNKGTTNNYGQHAEGKYTMCIGDASHAEGEASMAIGHHSHAEGEGSVASGACSHAEGDHTIAINEGEHACGKYNRPFAGQVFSIGVGESDEHRVNSFYVKNDGTIGGDLPVDTTNNLTGLKFDGAIEVATGIKNGGSLKTKSLTFTDSSQTITRFGNGLGVQDGALVVTGNTSGGGTGAADGNSYVNGGYAKNNTLTLTGVGGAGATITGVLTSDATGFLPTTGGTLTGNLTVDNNGFITLKSSSNSNSQYNLTIKGGDGNADTQLGVDSLIINGGLGIQKGIQITNGSKHVRLIDSGMYFDGINTDNYWFAFESNLDLKENKIKGVNGIELDGPIEIANALTSETQDVIVGPGNEQILSVQGVNNVQVASNLNLLKDLKFKSGKIAFDGSANKLLINSDTISGSTALTVQAKSSKVNLSDGVIISGQTEIDLFAGSDRVIMRDGSISTESTMKAGAYYTTSDERLKTNIIGVSDDEIEKAKKVDLKSFNLKRDGKKHFGVVAQEVEAAGLTELVNTDSEGMKSVDYTSLLILKIAELEKEIKDLKNQINNK